MISAPQIADDLPVPILLFSGNRGLTWINQSGQVWLGSSLKTLSGRTLESLFHDCQDVIDAVQKTEQYDSLVHIHDLIVRPRGKSEVKCEVTTFTHDGSVGIYFMPLGRQTIVENIFSDGASALGRLLAHEIKNPLAGIHGAAQLLRDDVEGEEALSLLNLIRTEIERIRRLADRMERLGDVSPSDFSEVNIHEILRHARKVIQSGAPDSISFAEEYDPSLPLALGHHDSLTQAVMNLIKNATESFQESSVSPEIRLETSYRTSGAGLPIEIRIIDNGSGIPEHIRDKIFHPFITDKPEGQGLGLALVSKIIASHDGAVEVQSKPGETIFSILLPLYQKVSQ